ncbi:MAG: DUF4159 domain-containing protein [Planctomycetota bacterium]
MTGPVDKLIAPPARSRPAALVLCVLVAALLGAVHTSAAPAPTADQIERSVSAGSDYLLRRLETGGMCRGEYPQDDVRYGGKTALVLYALLSTGRDPEQTPVLEAAVDWLTAADLTGTYARSTRGLALASLPGEPPAQLARDVEWLVRAAYRDGSYTYTSAEGKKSGPYDNSNSQFAPLAVRSAMDRGVEVPRQYWQRVQRHWQLQQQPGGGWGYRQLPAQARTPTYGSMTAAGLATLYLCEGVLKREQFLRCTAGGQQEAIRRGLAWLEERFTPQSNPGKGIEWVNYWLWCVQRVGLASGHRHLGGRDWYAEGAGELLRRQNGDGSWGYGERTVETAFGLLFLARGHSPILLSKLRYEGKWNPRPRDAANLTHWLSATFERPVTWQIVSADAPVEDLLGAPILYISGAGPAEFTDAQVHRLREYVRKGGTILSEAACNNGDFTVDIQRLYDRLLPHAATERVPEDHPAYQGQFPLEHGTGLSMVSNGIRPLAIHSAQELSLGLQLGPGSAQRESFDLLGNLHVYLTDRGQLPPRTTQPWPAEPEVSPRRTLGVARLVYDGNWNPEPLGWQRLNRLALAEHRIAVRTEPIAIAELDAETHPVAHLTGTEAVTFSAKHKRVLADYFADGGTLIVDAGGGAKSFAQAVEKQIFPLVGNGWQRPLPADHALYLEGPETIERVRYRGGLARTLGPGRHTPRLRGVEDAAGRIAIVYSPEDLTAGLVGYPLAGLRGYTPDSAWRVMLNTIDYAASQGLAESELVPAE